MTTALGIAPDAEGNGTTPLHLRKIIQSRWANPGIVTGLKATGRSDLTYNLSAGVAVCQRSVADGCTEAYWPGGVTAATTAGDPSNPRIDLVCIKANDPTQGDSDNQVSAIIVKGAPAVNPAIPATPAGAVAVATMRMPAGATATNAATVLSQPDYAIPYGGSIGVLASARVTTQSIVGPSTGDVDWHTRATKSVYLPSRRRIRIQYQRTMTTHDFSKVGSLVVQFWVNGTAIITYELLANGAWETHDAFWEMELDEGTHTIAVRDGWHEGSDIDLLATHIQYPSGGAGMVFTIIDLGVA